MKFYLLNANEINESLAKNLNENSLQKNLASFYEDSNAEFKRVCVYPSWSTLQESDLASLKPEEIDPFLCTHIHYAYANLDLRTLQLVPSQIEDVKNGEHGDVILRKLTFNFKSILLIQEKRHFTKDS